MMLMRYISMRHKIQLIISMCIDIDRIMDALRDMSEHGAAESIDLCVFSRNISMKISERV